MPATLKETLMQRLETLPPTKLSEVLLFVEFLSARESPEFIAYVNERTKTALKAKVSGEKFYTLSELQKEFRE